MKDLRDAVLDSLVEYGDLTMDDLVECTGASKTRIYHRIQRLWEGRYIQIRGSDKTGKNARQFHLVRDPREEDTPLHRKWQSTVPVWEALDPEIPKEIAQLRRESGVWSIYGILEMMVLAGFAEQVNRRKRFYSFRRKGVTPPPKPLYAERFSISEGISYLKEHEGIKVNDFRSITGWTSRMIQFAEKNRRVFCEKVKDGSRRIYTKMQEGMELEAPPSTDWGQRNDDLLQRIGLGKTRETNFSEDERKDLLRLEYSEAFERSGIYFVGYGLRYHRGTYTAKEALESIKSQRSITQEELFEEFPRLFRRAQRESLLHLV